MRRLLDVLCPVFHGVEEVRLLFCSVPTQTCLFVSAIDDPYSRTSISFLRSFVRSFVRSFANRSNLSIGPSIDRPIDRPIYLSIKVGDGDPPPPHWTLDRVLDDVAGMLGEVQAGGVATISVLHPCPVVVARKKVAGLTKVNKQPYTIKRMRDNKKNERSILYIPAIPFFFLLLLLLF